MVSQPLDREICEMRTGCHAWPRRVLPLSGEAHLEGCLKGLANDPLERECDIELDIELDLDSRHRNRHPVTMGKELFRKISTRRVCVLRHQTGAQYSAAE